LGNVSGLAGPRPTDNYDRDGMQATILLIDDNAVQAATRQAILKRAGFFVIAVLSPERALEQYRNEEYPAPINLIITDHIMPGMTGAEFVKAVRSFDPRVPVLVISGLLEAEDEYHDLGVHFRLKPLLPDDLLASVNRLIASGQNDHTPAAQARSAEGFESQE
jgi:DNA-binding NtrC family response regulator